jgi:tRNA-2-methylthio-N6-dimethylallyladenosine synthase
MRLIRDIGFAQAFSFKYSPRPGTPAAGAPGLVPEAEKDRRLAELQALIRDQQDGFNARTVGLDIDVLITGPGRRPGQIAGRSPYLQAVHLDGPESLIGQVVPVKVRQLMTNSLSASLTLPAFKQERASA